MFGPRDFKLIGECISSGHHSILEHVSFTFIVDMSRVAQQQFTRHRLASFSIQSGRYTEPSTEAFYFPTTDSEFAEGYARCVELYRWLVSRGVKREDARYLIPMGWLSRCVISANLREWRHIFAERMCKHAQFEIRSIVENIYQQIQEINPVLVWKSHKKFWGCPEALSGCGVCCGNACDAVNATAAV